MNMKVERTLRHATRADLESVVRLASEFREYLRRDEPSDVSFRQSFSMLLDDPLTEILLVRDANLGDVGYIQCRYRVSAWNTPWEVELEDVFVSSAARRRGAGRQLLEFALERARSRGCRTLGLTTNERNFEALALYQSFGFTAERERWKGGRQLWLDRPIDR